MTPATPVTGRNEIQTAKRGMVYKGPYAVPEILTVTKCNGPDGASTSEASPAPAVGSAAVSGFGFIGLG
jgi:hypothetical protein